MARPSAVGAVLLLVLMAPARSEEPPDPGKIQFQFGFPAGVYLYRQAVSGETFQQMDGRDLMRDRTELAVTFARIERDANGACAVFSFASDLPPTAAAGGGAATLAKAEGSHTGVLRYDLATRLVREYRDETKWVNHFSMAGPAGTVRQVLANAYTSHVQIVPVSDDPGPLPPDLAPDAGDGGDEEHADEE